MTTVPRLARVEDADQLGELLHAFNAEFEWPTSDASDLARRLRLLLSEESTFAIVAGDPLIALALVTLRPNVWYDGPVVSLDEMYVVPNRRSQGVGSAVIEFLIVESTRRGVSLIEINVDEADDDAQRFYERHGFTGKEPATGERAFYFHRELEDAPE